MMMSATFVIVFWSLYKTKNEDDNKCMLVIVFYPTLHCKKKVEDDDEPLDLSLSSTFFS